ncbi:MAG TPA: hypothetical protein VK879_22035 [Candidatus Sulfomarinibacteraceae bacterium]|nr:hypothetical protein [Candidatus Sulfomarinibacteraceae bacterium]
MRSQEKRNTFTLLTLISALALLLLTACGPAAGADVSGAAQPAAQQVTATPQGQEEAGGGEAAPITGASSEVVAAR